MKQQLIVFESQKLSDHYGHVILLGEIILRDTTSDLFDLEITL